MQAVECSARDLNGLLEEIGEERAREVTELAEELAAACRALEDGLAPLEQQACLVSTPTWTAM